MSCPNRTHLNADAQRLATLTGELIGQVRSRERQHVQEAASLSLSSPVPDPFSFQLVDPIELTSALDESRSATDEGSRTVHQVLKRLSQLPASRRLSLPPSLEALRALSVRFPNFAHVVNFLLQHAALSQLHPKSPLHLPPIVVDGPPGIGKTAFSLAAAKAFGVPLIQLQMAHATGSFTLGGLDPQYAGGGPGFLTRKVALGLVPDPVVLLDELDKTPADGVHDPLGALYSLLEPETARQFVDDGLKLPLDFSALRWICTTNDQGRLHPAIRSRCEVFRVEAPTTGQLIRIARGIYAQILKAAPWGAQFSPELPDAVALQLARTTPRELGRSLRTALGNAVLDQRRYLLLGDLPLPAERPGMGFHGQ